MRRSKIIVVAVQHNNSVAQMASQGWNYDARLETCHWVLMSEFVFTTPR